MTVKSLPAPDPENDHDPPRGSRRRQAQGARRAECRFLTWIACCKCFCS